MKHLPGILLLVIVLHLSASAAAAVQITIVAEDYKGRPVKDVHFTSLATGAVSAPTTAEGRTKVELPAGLKPGDDAELNVGRVHDAQPDWVFISPWNRIVKVPKPGDYYKVVLARRGDREALESGDGLRAMTASILAETSKAATPQQPVTEEQRKRILEEQAARFGLPAAEIDKAIMAWKERAQDPYDIGIAALYERNYPKAAEQLEKSLKVRKTQEAEFREKVAEAAYFLGQAQYEQGHYAQAAESYRQALERRPDDALTMNAYGLTLVETGKYQEAEPLLKRSTEISEKALGKDHPNVTTYMSNLAFLYYTQSKYAEAEPLLKRSLEIREKAMGKDHPDVAQSLNNLAELYRAQGKYAEAEPLLKRSLEISERALRKDHPDVATYMNNLALLYDAQGKYAEAEPLLKRSLEISERALRKDHPDVAMYMNNLAELYDAQGKYAEAEPLLKRSLEIREKALGKDHPDVAQSLNNLAGLYRDQGKYAEAEPLYRRALSIVIEKLGDDHPTTHKIRSNLEDLEKAQRKTSTD
jgi:tetratricopeptide (TPR) repeat protein